MFVLKLSGIQRELYTTIKHRQVTEIMKQIKEMSSLKSCHIIKHLCQNKERNIESVSFNNYKPELNV